MHISETEAHAMTQRRTRPITAAEYWRMAELGFFNSERVEFIGGEIVGMSPQTNWHVSSVMNIQFALMAIFDPQQYWVRNQATLDLSPFAVPDPDVAVIVGSQTNLARIRTYPTTALLIVEVSETTLADDRARKASLYAAARIADYWIVNLVDAVLEVRRDPRVDATAEFGMSYGSLATLQRSDDVSPLAMPSARIAVDALFPF